MKTYNNRKNKNVGKYKHLIVNGVTLSDNIQTVLFLLTERIKVKFMNTGKTINNPFVKLTDNKEIETKVSEIELDFDILGDVYSSMVDIRTRSKNGMFFTPLELIEQVDLFDNQQDVVLDPCCGTGRLLIHAGATCKKVIGIELDPIAASIARVNMEMCFDSDKWEIITGDCLGYEVPADVTCIYSNPPYNSEVMDSIVAKYNIKDKKFIMYLPNSILNLKHRTMFDNLKNYHISNQGKKFKDVMSSIYVVRNDIPKDENKKLREHWTMRDWKYFMGVVTGDNSAYLSDTYKDGYLLCLDGKRKLKYLKWGDHLQQKVSLDLYNAPKLTYNFIGDLTVEWDSVGLITLNSLNCIIPPDTFKQLDIQILVSWLNSNHVKTWLKDTYDNLKNLKEHLQNIPIPYFTNDELETYKKTKNFDFVALYL